MMNDLLSGAIANTEKRALFPFVAHNELTLQRPSGGIPDLHVSAEMACEKELAVRRVVDRVNRSKLIIIRCRRRLKNMERLGQRVEFIHAIEGFQGCSPLRGTTGLPGSAVFQISAPLCPRAVAMVFPSGL